MPKSKRKLFVSALARKEGEVVSVSQVKNLLKEMADRAEAQSPKNNDKAIAQLVQAHTDSNLVLVLGAGVSVDMGLLDWTTLLQKLLLKSIVRTTRENERRSDLLANLFNKVF